MIARAKHTEIHEMSNKHWPPSEFEAKPDKTIWNIRFHYAAPARCDQHVGGETMTQQHMAEACDINNIMARYEETGLIDHLNQYQGEYGDFTVMPDFHTAMNKIKAAEEMFLTLPAKVREKFENDPGSFVEFATNEDNLDEMRELGLAPKASKSEQPKQQAKAAKQPPEKEVKTAPASEQPTSPS